MATIQADRQYKKWAIFFTTPNIILFILFFAIPAFLGLLYSFTNYNGFSRMDFVGLKNYNDLFHDTIFMKVALKTILYVLLVVPLIYISSLSTAILFTSKTLKIKAIVRVFIYIPTLFSTVLVGLTWRWIFGEKFGLFNYIISSLGFDPISWATNPTAALITTLIATVWASTGFYMLIFIGGIENIEQSLYEAATIDGANDRQQFWYITLPQLRPITFLVVILSSIEAFKVFALVVTLTGGGPGNSTLFIIQYIYRMGFSRMKVGYASAASMLLFAVLITLSIIRMVMNNREERS